MDDQNRLSGLAAFEASQRMAFAYRRLGGAGGSVVAFLSTCSARHAAAWFAAPLGGQVACSLHVRETPQRLAETLRWLGAQVIVHDEPLADLARDAVRLSELNCARICLGERGDSEFGWDEAMTVAGGSHPLPVGGASGGEPAAIILSSGSTGKPKGVTHTHSSLCEAAQGGQYALGGLNRHDAGLLYMQPSFAGWSIILLPVLAAKAKIVFGARFTPALFLETVARERVTLAPLVPTMWRMVFDEDLRQRDLSSLRMVTIAGEPPAESDIRSLHERVCPRIASLYLSAEGHVASGVIAFTDDLLRPGKAASTGHPAPGVDVRVIDPAGGFDDELAPGEEGEIAISGPSIAAGYWNDPELTAQRFHQGWWRSGDLGRVDEDGDLWVTGRIDNVINTGGIKVSGEEVERAILSHPQVAQCAVVGVADERFGNRIEAWVVRRGGALTVEDLDAFCRQQTSLPSFKVPKAFHLVTELPTGPTGKLYRRALRGAV